MKSVCEFVLDGCLVCALITASAVAGAACNKTPVPPQSVQAFGRDMIVNGVPTSVVGMEFAGTASDVSKAFREFWINEDVPAKGQSNSSGLMLSALDDHCLYMLAIPAQPERSRTRGLMSVIRLGDGEVVHRIPDSAVPLPEGSKILSDVESQDPGQTGRTWLLDISGDARWNAQRYRNSLVAQGWMSVGRQPDYQAVGKSSAQGTAFAMQHGRDSMDVSFSDNDGRTVAVINATRNR
ncbi:hypothetical protein PQR64_37025 [Paraburkholderia phytofirmans]|uniref:hypothetical protein n=1 Tax=Paraburkholderia phytofirmans TaxID=261302 RepID=UPI0038BA1D75